MIPCLFVELLRASPAPSPDGGAGLVSWRQFHSRDHSRPTLGSDVTSFLQSATRRFSPGFALPVLHADLRLVPVQPAWKLIQHSLSAEELLCV